MAPKSSPTCPAKPFASEPRRVCSIPDGFRSRVGAERRKRGADPSQVFLDLFRPPAGRCCGQNVNDGNEDQPRGRRLVDVLVLGNVDLDGNVGGRRERRARFGQADGASAVLAGNGNAVQKLGRLAAGGNGKNQVALLECRGELNEIVSQIL